jgi:hypothetical protein
VCHLQVQAQAGLGFHQLSKTKLGLSPTHSPFYSQVST